MTRPCESGLHDGVARERRARGGAAGRDGASPRVGWHLAVRRRDDSGPHRGAPPVPLGTALLTQLLIAEKWLTLKGVIGLWPANTDGDDIVVWTDETRHEESARFHTIRQQMVKDNEQPNFALADFVKPVGTGPDWVGGFCVTAGHGELEKSEAFKQANDDYSSIMVKALADRFAEAFAEYLHAQVRRKFWGYAPDEALSNEDLISEKYDGIRPAPGYPAQPDHTEKETLFRLLEATDRKHVI